MEDKHKPASEEDFGDEEDNLSLCNLPIHGCEYEDTSPNSRRGSTSPDQELFEFCGGGLASELSRNNSVVFFGKNINPTDGGDNNNVNEYRKRDYLGAKSASFHKPRGYQLNDDDRDCRTLNRNRSSSLRFSSSDLCHSKQSSLVQKVNITAITSMSAQSRRRMFMFGPMKFKPEMDVIAIKKRQGRRPPLQIPPMPEGGEVVTYGGGCGGGGGGGKGKAGGGNRLLPPRPLWSRSHLATALAKSLGCISGAASIV